MENKKVKSRFNYYLKIWLMMSKNSFLGYLQNRTGLVIFTCGKILRFGFFALFLIYLLRRTENLAGYNLNQTLFFFLTFNLVDVMAQFLYREVYRFRPLIVEGGFDLILIKPWNALFRSLMGGADLFDLLTIPPLMIGIYLVGQTLSPTFIHALLYLLLLINGLLIATAFHIAVISLGIISLEIDHTVMIYRDLTSLGRLPVDIYKEPLRGILTFLVPVGIMMTFPAKALMGILSPTVILISLGLGVISIFAAIRFWNLALRYYTSASS